MLYSTGTEKEKFNKNGQIFSIIILCLTATYFKYSTISMDDTFLEYSVLISTRQPLNFRQSVSRLFADYYNFFLFLSSKQQCSRDCRIGQGRIISTNIEHEQAQQAAPVAAAAALLQCNLDLKGIQDKMHNCCIILID